MTQDTFEATLVAQLQPVRQFALAQALYHFAESGALDEMDGHPDSRAERVATACALDPERLVSILRYLQHEGYVEQHASGAWSLTDAARDFRSVLPWYQLLVGGYATTFEQLGMALRRGDAWASRNGAEVGRGSTGMSMYDALPLIEDLLGDLAGEHAPRTVVDLGCGDARILLELCRRHPGLTGIAADPEAASVARANELIAQYDMTDRVRAVQAGAVDLADHDFHVDGNGLCFVTAFVLQEVLEQAGEAAVEDLLRRAFDRYPLASWVVIEVDHRPNDHDVMGSGLGLAYYNPYYLIHAITEQRLETREFWDALFKRAGLRAVRCAHPPATVDSTDLELGYLLRRS